MKIDKFLEEKGIDPAQIVSYHYSEVNGEPPPNGIDFDVEELLREFGKQVLDEAAEQKPSEVVIIDGKYTIVVARHSILALKNEL